MAGFSGTPLWRKLGYKAGMAALVDGKPVYYLSLLDLPSEVEVTWLARPGRSMAFVHLFATAESELRIKLKGHRKGIAPDGVVWVSWPKKASGVVTDISENVIREVALPMGLVDIKVCAVDRTWSGLKLMVRKELR